jgi:hypothetical protein
MRWMGLTAGMCILASSTLAQDASVEHGRYVAIVGGCNDCHTPSYGLAEGNVPESEWLKGDSMGWRGPWGTTYATNLRRRLGEMSEDDWVAFAKTFETRPPMPWFNVHQMNETDLRSFYKYATAFEDKGEPAPDFVPPDQEPQGPYIQFPAPPPQ